MTIILQFIGWGLIIVNLLVILSSVIGLFRFPDFYTKIHAASLIDSCGLPLSLIGLSCLQTNINSAIKLIFAAVAVLLLNPVATHALAKAAYVFKLRSKDLSDRYKNVQ